MSTDLYDVLILGGGPAGLSAATYAIHKQLNVLMISKDLGGKTNYRFSLPWMPADQVAGSNLVRGLEVVNKILAELDRLKINRIKGTVETVRREEDDFVISARLDAEGGETKELRARTVILATGTRQIPLGVPGEQEFFMRGMSYSTLSYASLFEGRTVAVVGEGELAIRSTAELALNAQQVYLVCTHGQMLSMPLGQKLRQTKNVKILEGFSVQEIKGDGLPGEGYVHSLILTDRQGQVQEIAVDGVFIEQGLQPNSQMVAGLVSLDAAGRVQVDTTCQTNVPGLFAAGDVTNLYGEQLLVAIGDGIKAALSASDYLLPVLVSEVEAI